MTNQNPTNERETMKVICAWCGKALGEKQGSGISHGMCDACFSVMKQKIAQRAAEAAKHSLLPAK